jgi:hypothetical protein
MITVTKQDLKNAGYDIIKVEGRKIGAFNSFYGVTDENKYNFDLDEAKDYVSKDTLTLFKMDSNNIIIDYWIDDFYGDVIERKIFLRAEQFVGKKFV